jgi:small subunit ribosomal protein S17
MKNKEMTAKKHFFKGIVISKKMLSTATVEIQRVFKDLKVNKIVRRKTKFHVHDPLNITKVGDEILFFEGKHISKIKYMYFHSIVNKAELNKELV